MIQRLLLLASLLLLPAFADAPPAKPTLKTVKVATDTFRVSVEFDGVLTSGEEREIRLAPEAWGMFEVVSCVAPGIKVTKGTPLIVFSTDKIDQAISDLEASQTQADLAITRAEADLSQLRKAQPLVHEQTQRTASIAAEDLKLFHDVVRPEDERQLAHMVKRNEDWLDYEEEELKQLEEMYGQDQVTEKTEEIVLRRQRDTVAHVRFMLAAAKLMRDMNLKTYLPRQEGNLSIAAQASKLELAKTTYQQPLDLSRAEADLAKQKYDRGRQQEHLARLRRDRSRMVVEAPMDGIVFYGYEQQGKWQAGVSSQLRPGGKLPPGVPLLAVVKPRPLNIIAQVPAATVRDLRAGLEGYATPAPNPDQRLQVTIESVSAVPVAAGSYLVTLEPKLGKGADAVMPGMACHMTFVPYLRKQALLLPDSAVFVDPEAPDAPYVYLPPAKDEPPRRQTIRVGRHTDKLVEILGGLKTGDAVLADRPKLFP